jgi:CubicO group peptidase (beta-lactamase class C family)
MQKFFLFLYLLSATLQLSADAQFNGTTGQLQTCVALYDQGQPQRDMLDRRIAYDVTLQLETDDLIFRLVRADERPDVELNQCRGRFESGVYEDRVVVREVSPQTDGDYFIRMDLLAEQPDRLQLREHELTMAVPAVRFQRAAAYSRLHGGDALLVARNGHLLFADYVSPFALGDAHLLASGTKSFSHTLFVLGAMDGLWSLDEPVYHTIIEWRGDARREAVTIRHLLTLSSGLVNAEDFNAAQVSQLDIYDLAVNHSPQLYDAGEVFHYGAVNFLVLAAMFERKTGLDPADYLYQRVLGPLGMTEAHLAMWMRDRHGKPQMAGGAYLDAQTWLNYGQLMLQRGQWRGRQLLTAPLLEQAWLADNPAYQGYGLTWWRNTAAGNSFDPGLDSVPTDGQPDGGRILPALPDDVFFAAGLGKQRLYIMPSQQLVVVRFGRTLGGLFDDQQLLLHVLAAFN